MPCADNERAWSCRRESRSSTYVNHPEYTWSTSGTSAASDTSGADLFKSMDTNNDGTLSKTELTDGAKKLFDELRTQLMTTSGETSAETKPQGPPPGPPPAGGHGGGLFSKLESLLDQYRSTATDSSSATQAATPSVAA